MGMLSAGDLLAGGKVVHEVKVPAHLAAPGDGEAGDSVRLRPLTVRDLHLITRAARDKDDLASALMVQAALEEPRLELAQVYRLPVGLMEFLLDEVNRISGIGMGDAELEATAEEPLLRAAHILAREFGWTPEQVGELTLGQLVLNLQLLKERAAAG